MSLRNLPAAICLSIASSALPIGSADADWHLTAEQQAMTTEQRNRVYAPWDPADIGKLRKAMGLVGPGPTRPYPTARFPGYLQAPESLDDLMPQARHAVQQKGGRTPLGLADPGDIVLIPIPYTADPLVQEAIRRAFAERRVEARLLYEHELAAVDVEDLRVIDEIQNVFRAGDGQQELNYLRTTGRIADWDHAVAWTREQDPVLANATWPRFEYPEERLAELARNYRSMVEAAVRDYLDKHPEVTKIFWRTGGRPFVMQALQRFDDKFVGNYTYLNNFDIMSKVPAYPSDVWRMIEGKMIEPMAYTDRVEVSDPEGSAFYFELTPDEARIWSQGSYLQGHIFMLPSQSSGVFPFSFIEYPAMRDDWLPTVQMTTANGIVASSNSHASNHPRIEIHIKDGYVQDVRGGGLYGDGFRLWLGYPQINDLTWPFQEQPGFWWLFEAGTGTNPKYFKHPGEVLVGQNLSERNAGGVIHWSFGAEVKMGPEKDKPKSQRSPESVAFGKQHKLPIGHAMHNHNLLPTYQVRLRDSGRWQTVIEHGQILASEDPEVRALASRYGNPDEVLRRDWIPELPGITVPGNYDADYSSDPGRFWTQWAQSIYDGTNRYFDSE
ncbi:MAG: hypothetical protein R3176_01280 [Woeseiaceae bacterium]|nr:hypothetical protein [Woeseiaceae bacterium]